MIYLLWVRTKDAIFYYSLLTLNLLISFYSSRQLILFSILELYLSILCYILSATLCSRIIIRLFKEFIILNFPFPSLHWAALLIAFLFFSPVSFITFLSKCTQLLLASKIINKYFSVILSNFKMPLKYECIHLFFF